MEMGTLEAYIAADPDAFATKIDAARARDKSWSAKVNAPMKRNFGQSRYKPNLATEVLKPGEYLQRAKDHLDKIDLDSESLLPAPENEAPAVEIGPLTFTNQKSIARRARKQGQGPEHIYS